MSKPDHGMAHLYALQMRAPDFLEPACDCCGKRQQDLYNLAQAYIALLAIDPRQFQGRIDALEKRVGALDGEGE